MFPMSLSSIAASASRRSGLFRMRNPTWLQFAAPHLPPGPCTQQSYSTLHTMRLSSVSAVSVCRGSGVRALSFRSGSGIGTGVSAAVGTGVIMRSGVNTVRKMARACEHQATSIHLNHHCSGQRYMSHQSSAAPRQLSPSECFITMPQLSPMMQSGRIVQWLISPGARLEPHQLFLLLETDELTEDRSTYIMEVESHESGQLKEILQQADQGQVLKVGTPIAVFHDPDHNDVKPGTNNPTPKRGEFLWQAYVKSGTTRAGCCTPQRGCDDDQ